MVGEKVGFAVGLLVGTAVGASVLITHVPQVDVPLDTRVPVVPL